MFKFKFMGKDKNKDPEVDPEKDPEVDPPEKSEVDPPEKSEDEVPTPPARMTRQEKKAWRRKNRKEKELEKDASAAAE